MSRFLITTADERAWPVDQPVLFLGEWCRLYRRKAAWVNLDAEVVPYHWDDRDKLFRDYQYLRGLYEELLEELRGHLNALHSVEHSLQYWRILVGPWLGYFLPILFDRWMMIERAVNEYAIAGAQVLETPPEDAIPNHMEHFSQLLIDDPWNGAIYGELLQGWTDVSVEKVRPKHNRLLGTAPPVTSIARKLKQGIIHALSGASQLLAREHEVFFLSSYLPTIQDWRLQWRLGQIPKVWRSIPAPTASADLCLRQRSSFGRADAKGFSAIARAMVARLIPSVYVEGYGELRRICQELPWPSNPRAIFTSVAFHADDVFKAWAAAKVDAGTPLVIGQHGGAYGVARWLFSEKHEYAISDAWVSWGWGHGAESKIKPVGNLKLFGLRIRSKPEGTALMVEMAMPRYSYHMYAVPVASQWIDYFEEQVRFVNALPGALREQLVVRLYGTDYSWCQAQRWRDRFPSIRIDDGARTIKQLIEKSRLYISTYNATTFLETLAMNVPTIMFWNPRHWELRESAIPHFEQLEKVGIFHQIPESAAQQMATVWDNVDAWWNSESVQTARKEFCNCYSRIPDEPLRELEAVFERLAPRSV